MLVLLAIVILVLIFIIRKHVGYQKKLFDILNDKADANNLKAINDNVIALKEQRVDSVK